MSNIPADLQQRLKRQLEAVNDLAQNVDCCVANILNRFFEFALRGTIELHASVATRLAEALSLLETVQYDLTNCSKPRGQR